MIGTNISGTIFNIQKFSVHDGPGIRTTVFMKGCPLSCKWCSNAESMSPEPEPGIIRSVCNLCGVCVETCPHNAVCIEDDSIQIDRLNCDACGQCVDECTPGAITIYGRQVTVREVLKEIVKDKAFYSGSDGGITVSGGEPLRQSGFVAGLFRQCKDEGIGTCLDTCGYAPEEKLQEVLPYTDYILYDLKVMDQESHREFTGVNNAQIRKNAKTVVDSEADVLFRIPLIDGVNSDLENIEATAKFIDSLGKNNSVELLPYHRLGIGKYKTLDKEYPGTELQTPSGEDIDKIVKIFEKYGINCTVGG